MTLKVSLIQMASGPRRAANLARAIHHFQQASRIRPNLVLYPEALEFRGKETDIYANSESVPGPITRQFGQLAREAKCWILLGSIGERITGSRKVYNTSVLLNSRGQIAVKYRKIHLFDAALKTKRLTESRYVLPGRHPRLVKVAGQKLGLSICYDLRFPILYQRYAKHGATMLTVPSNFTYKTGQDHWELLLRARAIENQCFVLAPNQCRQGSGGVKAYGNSMIVDPWGRVLARASTNREEILTAKLDFQELHHIRHNLPSLKHSTLLS